MIKYICSFIIVLLAYNSIYSQERNYSDKELIIFFDSIGQLNPSELKDKEYFSDSLFLNTETLNIELAQKKYTLLKESIRDGLISTQVVIKIIPNNKIKKAFPEIRKNTMANFYSFSDDEFAIVTPNEESSWNCFVYFFKGNKIISKHQVCHKYGLGLNHYKDEKGRTFLYYNQIYSSGSGIWWLNYYFYMYDGDSIVPVLNVVKKSNYSWPGCIKFWLEADVENTNPLVLKMNYNVNLLSIKDNEEVFVVDTTERIKYNWDENAKKYVPAFYDKGLNQNKIESFYFESHPLLMINSFYDSFKKVIDTKEIYKDAFLNELDEIKYYLEK